MALCDSCTNNANMYSNCKLNLCKNCLSIEPSILITQTNAVTEFPVTVKDLTDVRCFSRKSAWSRHSYTHLFLIADITQVAINKYGSENGFKEAQTQRIIKKTNRSLAKLNSKEMRKNALTTHLQSLGLPGIRADSVLCEKYVTNQPDALTIEVIGEIMLEMRFFYEQTRYPDIFSEQREDAGEYYVEEEVREDAKNEALREYVLNKPNFDLMNVPNRLRQKATQYHKSQMHP